jgi:hypothetical protein
MSSSVKIKLPRNIIPQQVLGAKTGAVAHKLCSDGELALALYHSAVDRLSTVNDWHNFAKWNYTQFYLHDARGLPVLRKARSGDLIRIRLPLPASKKQRYEWVRVEEVSASGKDSDVQQNFTVRVRPASDPLCPGSRSTAHFYTRHATSTFCVVRSADSVWALELGRNELPNNSGSLLNRIRNFVIAVSAWMGAAKLQWKALMEGILAS